MLVTLGGVGAFAVVNVYKNNEKFYKEILMPLVHQLDPEKSHELAIFASKYRLIPKSKYEDPNILVFSI